MVLPYPETVDPAMREAAIAATRFGYGARPGELRLIATDPRGWLLSQLRAPTVPESFAALPRSAPIIAGFMSTRQAGAEARRAYRRDTVAGVKQEALAHTAHALETDAPFLERLIRFLSNHFTISARNPKGLPLTFAHEREAIRPNAMGTLNRLMTETVRHPAMLVYYDNVRSIGPFSEAGLNGARGLNENLAREVLELHALGTGAEIDQNDVVALAKMLTGWSVAAPNEPNPGTFIFRPRWHEPNAKMLFNQRYPEAGVLEAEAALDTLSRQERTVRNLATKMARHFIQDDPPGELVADMLDGFIQDGNTIAGMATGMVNSRASWRTGQFKVKTPEDLVLSTARALGMGPAQAPAALDPGTAPQGAALARRLARSRGGLARAAAAFGARRMGRGGRVPRGAPWNAGHRRLRSRPIGPGAPAHASDPSPSVRDLEPLPSPGAAARGAGIPEALNTMTSIPPRPTRRQALALGAGAAVALSVDRMALAAGPKDRPLIVILLRGGLDGQALLPPHADPFYPETRGMLALPPPETTGGIVDLDGRVGLHPLAESLLPFWTRGELAVAPAVASPYRGRSHFEAQNVLESGLATYDPGAESGWLNRALAAVGAADGAPAIAMGDSVPLILRGSAAATQFGPSELPPSGPAFMARVAALYADDPLFSETFAVALRARDMMAAALGPDHAEANAMGARAGDLAVAAEHVGALLSAPDGSGVAVIEIGGWDTHQNQGAAEGPLARRIASLAEGLGALADGLGEAWSRSLVLTISEFGRTAGPNGTSGTDHGTGGAALLMGGGLSRAARLGAVPSLAPGDLLDGRDIAPTLDSRSLFKGVLARHWGVSRAALDSRVFPNSGDAAPIEI